MVSDLKYEYKGVEIMVTQVEIIDTSVEKVSTQVEVRYMPITLTRVSGDYIGGMVNSYYPYYPANSVVLTPPMTVEKRSITIHGPIDDSLGIVEQQLFNEVFNNTESINPMLETVQRHNCSSPVVFNQETRSAIVARIRTEYAENVFYGGIARRSMFNSTYRPVVAECKKFLETCVNDNIL